MISLIPSELRTKLGRKPITVRIETEYPFRMDVKVTVVVSEDTDCKVKLHIPAFAKTYTVNGEERSGSTCVLNGFTAGENVFNLHFTDTPHFVNRPDGFKTVEYGPLVFSLPIETEYKMYEYVRNNVERKFPYCDYELIGKSEWRYGFAEGATFSVVEKEGDEYPFSSKNPRLALATSFAPIAWEFDEGTWTVSAPKYTSNRALGDAEAKEMIPYGCAKLRMTEMPIAKKK